MKKGKDIAAEFGGLYLVHQNIPGKKAESVRYNQHILFIPLQGEIKIDFTERTFSFGLGQMLFLPANIRHSFSSSSQAGERLIAMIDQNKLDHDFVLAPTVMPLHQLIKEILFYLLLHPKTKNSKSLVNVLSETLTEALTEVKANLIASADHLEGRVIDSRVKRALSFMRDSLDRNPSMEQIAKHAGLSLRNLNRLVALETGGQPKQWMIAFRVEKAKELLKKPGASVTDVAFSVGYNSLGQFISAFRSRTGQLPSEYLKRG